MQDMLVLFCSTRRDGRSLAHLARDELGRVGASAAMVGTLFIMVILMAVLALVVVKAMAHSAWSTSTVFATIPIALVVGIYLRVFRPGRVLEATVIGVALLLLAVAAGGWVDRSPPLHAWFDLDAPTLAWFVIGYGLIAAILPVWLLLAPRDYLSTFVKLGVVFLLAIAICVLQPDIRMPALTRFIDGTGPIFSGKMFPVPLHHARLRCDLGFPRARLVGHDAQADRPRDGRADGGLRLAWRSSPSSRSWR